MKKRQLLIAGLCCCLASGQVRAARAQFSIKVESNLVLVDALVLDKSTHAPVGDLRAEDFQVKEEEKVQALTHFSRDELPISVLLLLDVSGSVQPILDQIKRSAIQAVGRLKPEDRVGLMAFGNTPVLVSHLSTNREQLAERLESLYSMVNQCGFATFIDAAVFEAARYLWERTDPEERRVIIMVSDEQDTTPAGWNIPRQVVLRLLHETGTTLCAIRVGRGSVARTAWQLGNTAALTAVLPPLGGYIFAASFAQWLINRSKRSSPYYAEHTGGIAFKVQDQEVGPALEGLLELLRARYTLGYVPELKGSSKDYRKIEVQVNGAAARKRGELKIVARKGYFLRASPEVVIP